MRFSEAFAGYAGMKTVLLFLLYVDMKQKYILLGTAGSHCKTIKGILVCEPDRLKESRTQRWRERERCTWIQPRADLLVTSANKVPPLLKPVRVALLQWLPTKHRQLTYLPSSDWLGKGRLAVTCTGRCLKQKPRLGFESFLYYLLAMWPWAGHLLFLLPYL